MSTAVLQGLGVAQALLDTHRDVIRRFEYAIAADDSSTADVTRGEAERSFSAIWEQLATAAKLTRDAGRDTAAYDAIASSGASHGIAIQSAKQRLVSVDHQRTRDVYTFTADVQTNDRGLHLARQALDSLWQVWPELAGPQNAVSNQPVADLRPGGILGFISRLFGG